MTSYFGRITSTLWPISMTALASAVTTSPIPPTFAMGAISTATCTTRSTGLLSPTAPLMDLW